jgi:hypothetical protein
MACPEGSSVAERNHEWRKLCNLLDHWSSSVKGKGYMDSVSEFEEDGQVFRTIWFARSVCGNCLYTLVMNTIANQILSYSLVLADVSPGPDLSLDHQSFPGLQLRARFSQNRS